MTGDSSFEQIHLLDFWISGRPRWRRIEARRQEESHAGVREGHASRKTSPACSSNDPTPVTRPESPRSTKRTRCMAYPPGDQTVGREAIRALWEKVLANGSPLRAGTTAADADQRRHRPHLDPAEGRGRRPGAGRPAPARRKLAAPARPARVRHTRRLTNRSLKLEPCITGSRLQRTEDRGPYDDREQAVARRTGGGPTPDVRGHPRTHATSVALGRTAADRHARTTGSRRFRSDGRPHTRPVWGVWLDGAFWFSTGSLADRESPAPDRPSRCTWRAEASR